MSNRTKTCTLSWMFALALLGLLAGGWLDARLARAAEAAKLDTSLKLIPENAAFYSCMLRNREQVEAVANSRAWKRIMDMPVVKMALDQYKQEAGKEGTVPNTIEAMLKKPDVIKVLDLLRDMGSQEIFCAGDENYISTMELMLQVMNAMQYGPMVAQIAGGGLGTNPNQIQIQMLLAALAENPERMKVPDSVMGFKIKDAAAAKEQMKVLEDLVTKTLDDIPELKGKFKRTKVGNSEYLVLSLDGSMIPWDQVPMDQLKGMEGEKGSADKVIARVKKMTLTISLGMRDNYLLLAVGPSTDYLSRLGTGKLLADRAELKPLAKHADKRLTGISYVSKPMINQMSRTKKDIDDMVGIFKELMPSSGLPDEMIIRITKDVTALAKDIKGLMPEQGAMMAFSFLSDRGIETYQYAWGEHPNLDGSKPLGLLQHVGGAPLLAAVNRTKVSISDYDLMVKWFNVGYGYFEEFGLPNIPETERKKAEGFLKEVKPLAKRFDKATREMLYPALADGQAALVIDAKLQSDRFIASLPKTEKPMPMIEPALIVGVSDAELLRKAFSEYREVIDGAINAARKIEGADIPKEIKVPEPKVSQAASGTIYAYALPSEWGVDAKIVPNFGLGKDVGVFSLSREHTERLLNTTPLKFQGVLADAKRPLAGATAVDTAGLIDAAAPWVNLGAQEILKQQGIEGTQKTDILSQVQTALEVLKVFRGATSEMYIEDGALVNHSLAEIRDIEK
jgi:hypothetical protein